MNEKVKKEKQEGGRGREERREGKEEGKRGGGIQGKMKIFLI